MIDGGKAGELAARLREHAGDVEARVELATHWVRQGQPEVADALLVEGERAALPKHPFHYLRQSGQELARLRQSRIDLGLYTYEGEADELIAWPLKPGSLDAPTWALAPERGSALSLGQAVLFRNIGIFVERHSQRGEVTRIRALDLGTGKELWGHAPERAVLLDMRRDDSHLVLHWYHPPLERGDLRGPQGGQALEWLDLASGQSLHRRKLSGWVHRAGFFRYEDWWCVVDLDPEFNEHPSWVRRHRVGLIDSERGSIAWQPARELPQSLQLVMQLHVTAGHPDWELVEAVTHSALALPGDGRVLGHSLHRSRDRYIVTAQTTHGPRPFVIGADGTLTTLAPPPRPKSAIHLPTYYRVGDRFIAVLQSYGPGRQSAGLVFGPFPEEPRRQAVPFLWEIDGGELTTLPFGHPNAHDAVLAGGVWLHLRESPTRIVAYTAGSGSQMALYDLQVAAEPATRRARSKWQRPSAPVRERCIPYGELLFVAAGGQLACFTLA